MIVPSQKCSVIKMQVEEQKRSVGVNLRNVMRYISREKENVAFLIWVHASVRLINTGAG